jgi:hypothetical protein
MSVYLSSIILGILLGAVGAHVTGYIAAIAISEKYLTILSPEITNLITALITQFLGFGLLAIIAGKILGRISHRWLLTTGLCYAGYIFYLSIGTAFVYNTEISNPYIGLSYWWLWPSFFVLPVCLILSNFLTRKKLR